MRNRVTPADVEIQKVQNEKKENAFFKLGDTVELKGKKGKIVDMEEHGSGPWGAVMYYHVKWEDGSKSVETNLHILGKKINNEETEKKNATGKNWKVGDTLVFTDDPSITATVTKVSPEHIWIKEKGSSVEKLARDGFDIEAWRKKR